MINEPFDTRLMDREEDLPVQAVAAPSLHISPGARQLLTETANWTRRMAFLSYAVVVLLFLFGLFYTYLFIFRDMGWAAMIRGVYHWLAAGSIYGASTYLTKYGSNIAESAADQPTNALIKAFANLQTHYKFMTTALMIYIAALILYIGLNTLGVLAYGFR